MPTLGTLYVGYNECLYLTVKLVLKLTLSSCYLQQGKASIQNTVCPKAIPNLPARNQISMTWYDILKPVERIHKTAYSWFEENRMAHA